MLTCIAASAQQTYMFTALGSATSNYNSQPQAAFSNLSCSLFIRYYYRNSVQLTILRLLICLNSAGLLAKHHVVMACSCTKGNAASQTTHEFAHCAHLLFNVVSHNSNSIIVYACNARAACTLTDNRHCLGTRLKAHFQELSKKHMPHSDTHWFSEFCKSVGAAGGVYKGQGRNQHKLMTHVYI